MADCDFCDHELPEGCRHLSGEFKECPLGPRTDQAWVVGMAIYKDLNDRRGIKQELAQIDDEIKVEIIETIGTIAIKAVKKVPY